MTNFVFYCSTLYVLLQIWWAYIMPIACMAVLDYVVAGSGRPN